MNKLLFALFFLALAVGSVYSAVGRIAPLPTPPAKYEGQPGCYLEELDIMLPLEELYKPVDGCGCRAYLCKKELIEIQTCGAVVVGPECEEDLSRPYPECCKENNCAAESD